MEKRKIIQNAFKRIAKARAMLKEKLHNLEKEAKFKLDQKQKKIQGGGHHLEIASCKKSKKTHAKQEVDKHIKKMGKYSKKKMNFRKTNVKVFCRKN